MNWKDIVRTIAPVLGTALGGPMAGAAVKALGDKFLGNSAASEKEIETAIMSSSPEQLLKLKEIETEFAKHMADLNIDVYRLEISDRQSAREMFKFNIWPQILLTAVYNIGFFTLLTIQGFNPLFKIDPSLMGILATIVPLTSYFWFGSSFGSQKKDSAIALSTPPEDK